MTNAPFKRGDIVLYKGERYAVVMGNENAEFGVPINWIAGGTTYRDAHPHWDFSASPGYLEKVTEMLDD